MSHGMIPQEIIERVKERIDIVELVSGYVTLTRAGQNLKALCPFHAEKTPSFTVSPSRQMFHCFGCGVGGNALTFLMKIEGGTFPEAVRDLAQRAGIDIPTIDGSSSPDRVIRDRLVQLNQRAALWFRQNLEHPDRGKEARAYLEQRGIQASSIEAFGLGVAIEHWDALLKTMSREGFAPADLLAAGLVVAKDQTRRSSDRNGQYDRFRGRLMFPIRDLQARVIAFGGRVLNDAVPKYLNSSDTPLFHKGRTLYAMDRAREAAGRLGTLTIVEGYFDTIGMHQVGLQNTVATLGTALTPEHVHMLRRYVSKVTLMFDPDAAGVRAALRALDLFMDSGVAVRVVSLPSGDDPDTFVRAHGPEAFQRLQESAPTLLDFTVEHSLQTAASGVIEDRIKSVDAILRVLHKAANRIEKEECIRRVAERLGINEQRLLERYPELVPAGRRSDPVERITPTMDRRFHGNPEERDLVQLLLQGHLTPAHLRALEADSFAVPACRRIVEIGMNHIGQDGRVRLRPLLDQAAEDPLCGQLASELSLAELHCDDVPEHVVGCLERLARKQREQVLGELIVKLRVAEREGRVEEAQRLNEQVNELRQSKAAMTAAPVRGTSQIPN